MGADYYAVTVIGVPVTGLYRQSAQLKCGHAQGPGKFCSKCGEEKALAAEPIEGLDVDEDRFFGLDAEPESYDTYLAPDGRWYVGFSGSAHGEQDAQRRNVPDIAALRAKIQKVLEPLGKWKPDKFGVWTFVRVSY